MEGNWTAVPDESRRGGRLRLDPRLSMIAELAGTCGRYADIGCDHGRLGAFLLQNGRCERAQLTDISEDSLKKARRLIGLLSLDDRVDFRVGDGAQALVEEPEVTVIAGMGGTLIARIVREGRQKLGRSRLVLQPNVAAPELRAALSEAGYRITDERVVQDGRRLYVVIAAEPGESAYDERELAVGPVLLRRKPESLRPYAAFRIRVAKKALAGARAGGDAEQALAIERELSIWEGVYECL